MCLENAEEREAPLRAHSPSHSAHPYPPERAVRPAPPLPGLRSPPSPPHSSPCLMELQLLTDHPHLQPGFLQRQESVTAPLKTINSTTKYSYIYQTLYPFTRNTRSFDLWVRRDFLVMSDHYRNEETSPYNPYLRINGNKIFKRRFFFFLSLRTV